MNWKTKTTNQPKTNITNDILLLASLLSLYLLIERRERNRSKWTRERKTNAQQHNLQLSKICLFVCQIHMCVDSSYIIGDRLMLYWSTDQCSVFGIQLKRYTHIKYGIYLDWYKQDVVERVLFYCTKWTFNLMCGGLFVFSHSLENDANSQIE